MFYFSHTYRVERQMKENTIELDSLHRQEAELKRRREEAVSKLLLLIDECSPLFFIHF